MLTDALPEIKPSTSLRLPLPVLFAAFLNPELRDLGDQWQRQRLVDRKLNGPARSFVSRELFCEGFHCGRRRIESDVVPVRRERDQNPMQ